MPMVNVTVSVALSVNPSTGVIEYICAGFHCSFFGRLFALHSSMPPSAPPRPSLSRVYTLVKPMLFSIHSAP